MDILIRILVAILCGIAIPYIANNIYKPLKDIKDLDIIEKALFLLLYVFVLNWFVIAPSVIFMQCFEYIVAR